MAIIVSTNFKIGAALPVDERFVVKTLAARDKITTKYKGLRCYVEAVDREFLWNGTQWIDTSPQSVVVVGSNTEEPILIEPTMPHIINVIEGIDEAITTDVIYSSYTDMTLSIKLCNGVNPEGTEVLPEGFTLYINNLSDKNVTLDMPLLGFTGRNSEGEIEGLYYYSGKSMSIPPLTRVVLKWMNMIGRDVYGFLYVHEFYELTYEEVEELNATKERVEALETSVADLLYVPIEISSFTHNAGTKEMGATVSALTLSWKTNKTPSAIKLSESLTGYGFNVPDVNDTTSILTNVAITMDSNPTFTLAVTDERDLTVTKTTKVNFYNGVYYGKAAEPEAYNSEFILGLSKNLRASKLTSFSATPGESEYIYYCLPKRMGVCTFTVGGFTGGFTLVDTISFTNASGYTEDYYIYKSDTTNLGSTTVSVS
ncbi:MAG: hypothetical protein ACI3XA_04620 [Clostridia bacterium]